jgi:hypothetical protein
VRERGRTKQGKMIQEKRERERETRKNDKERERI